MFVLKFYFATIISVRSTLLWEKGNDPDPDPYMWLTDPDPDAPKIYGSGTLDFLTEMHYICLQHIEIVHLDGFHEGSSDSTFLHLLNAADSGTARGANVVLRWR
jgi:hypothetical protein